MLNLAQDSTGGDLVTTRNILLALLEEDAGVGVISLDALGTSLAELEVVPVVVEVEVAVPRSRPADW